MGQIPNGSIDLIENIEDVNKFSRSKFDNSDVTQTTLSVDDTKDIINALKEKFSNIKNFKKRGYLLRNN